MDAMFNRTTIRRTVRGMRGWMRRCLGARPPAFLVPASTDQAQSLVAPTPSRCPAEPITIRNPLFNLATPPARPIVYVGDHLALTKTVYGHRMYVDTRALMGAHFLLDGYWEEWIVRHLRDYVKPGMRVVDVGANMGFYTLLLADLVGATGHVFAFEPQARLLDILRRNLELNGFEHRTTTVQKIIHARSGTYDFVSVAKYGNGGITGNPATAESSAPEPGNLDKPTNVRVEGVSLDEYFAGDDGPIDFIKLDAEGSEPFIFQGMPELLRRQRSLTIFCEFIPPLLQCLNMDPRRFLEEIAAAGFQISEFTAGGITKISSLPALSEVKWAELLLVRN
jgi:FkbM family methyltransferase